MPDGKAGTPPPNLPTGQPPSIKPPRKGSDQPPKTPGGDTADIVIPKTPPPSQGKPEPSPTPPPPPSGMADQLPPPPNQAAKPIPPAAKTPSAQPPQAAPAKPTPAPTPAPSKPIAKPSPAAPAAVPPKPATKPPQPTPPPQAAKPIPPAAAPPKIQAQPPKPSPAAPPQTPAKAPQKPAPPTPETAEDLFADEKVSSVERRQSLTRYAAIAGGGIAVIITIVAGIYLLTRGEPETETPATEPETTSPTIEPETTTDVEVTARDTDGDGIPDEWEIRFNLNPNNASDALSDSDFDQLTNLQEYEYGTNPKNSDTDNDGYLDGAEVADGYNPNGPGRLPIEGQTETTTTSGNYPQMAGEWQGTLKGIKYQINDLNLDLRAEGRATGAFSFPNSEANNQVAGNYSLDTQTYTFNSTLAVNSNLGSKTSSATLELIGNTSTSQDRVTGTFTLTPTSGDLIEDDYGTFSLIKISS